MADIEQNRLQAQREASKRYYDRKTGRTLNLNNITDLNREIRTLQESNTRLEASNTRLETALDEIKNQLAILLQRVNAQPEPVVEPNEQPEEPVATRLTALTLENAIEILQNSTLSAPNKKTNIQMARTVYKIIGEQDLMLFVNDIPRLVNKLNTAQMERGNAVYSFNSRKNFINCVIHIVKSEVPLKVIDNLWFEYKVYKLSGDLKVFAFKPQVVMNYHTYLNQAFERFGLLSSEFVYLSIFWEQPMRGELKNISFVNDKELATDETKNYLHIPALGNASIIMNTYKTFNRYGTKEYEYSNETSNLLRGYAHNQRFINNQKLFPRGSTLVGVNELRKSLSSTRYLENPSPRVMLELCDMMGHTANSHLSSYLFRVA